MTLIDADTGEIVATCTPTEARDLTDRIKGQAEALWSLLLEAHERRAWAALGYESWRTYATTEFGMSQRQAYHLLNQAQVIGALEAHSPGCTMVQPNERQARALAPLKAEPERMAEAWTEATARTEGKPTAAAVVAVVEELQAEAAQASEDRQALTALAAGMTKAFGPPEVRAECGRLNRVCRQIAELTDASETVDRLRGHLTSADIDQAERAYAWLDTFLLEVHQ